MATFSIRYGMLYGCVVSAVLLVPLVFGWQTDMKTGEIIGYTAMLLATVFVVLGILSLRSSEGSVSFGRAFLMGVLVSLIAGAVFGLATIVFYYYTPEFTEKYLAYYVSQLKASGISAAELKTKLAELDAQRWFFENPWLQGALMFATVFPMGAVVALVTALVVRRR